MLALAGCAATGRQATDYHYRDGRFHNIGARVDPEKREEGLLLHAVKMQLGLFPRAGELPPNHLLTEEAARAGLRRAARSQLAVTWIGHATALLRIGDKWVLTDPAMRPTVGLGPFSIRRLVPPRPELDALPGLDAILISHGDLDHLDLPTLRLLARRDPHTPVYVPLRNGPVVRSAGFRDVRELDWFGTGQLGELEVMAVPAIHGHRRPPHRLDSKLWVGWVVRSRGTAVYFSGDTAFGTIFEEIRRRAGPVDLALVPIGSYTPRSLQGRFHTNPEEAAEIARILGARTAIGIHWGTFPLSGEPPTEQKARFLAASGGGVSTHALSVGETLVLR